ncbi:MAG TPA: histidine kinase dimerization/phospho-acceptor domain-containing protein [Thermoanaerobaculia bacterium]|nr:histidine kinase dimerization/phospho-acceptor domain-containing protein [Thermoanaerobaculia bacterium]
MDKWLERFARAGFQRSSDTAHDLKTPLNVAVLNLELLRMRVRKLLQDDDDEKVLQYSRAIEAELRRMARIFDAFFSLSTPPKPEEAPRLVDLVPICNELAAAAGHQLAIDGAIAVLCHEARIRQALRLFMEGATNVLNEERELTVHRNGHFQLVVNGTPRSEPFDLSKVFKFYYTDSSGNPDLSLASARLIAETYGGALDASEDRGKVSIRISLPLGEA